MDARLNLIFARRSVRAYTRQPVSEEDIHGLLEAGMAAPSASNRRPWHFVVVRNRDALHSLAEEHPYGKMLEGAALAIAVCGDPSASEWWVQDCAAATENILLAATGLGLGSVWLGCHGRAQREDAVRSILGIPAGIGVLSLISLGHPAEHREPRTQYDEALVHWERY
jgi:nitroreductase